MTRDADEGIEEYAGRRQFYGDEIPDLVRESLRDPGMKTILEAGCGDGNLVHALVRSGAVDGRRLLACDLSEERVKRVRAATGAESFVDDIERLDHVADASIDFYISSMVIEHVDDGRMANAIARVTRPGARIYLSTVFRRWYGWYFHRAPCGWALDPTHRREYEDDAELLVKFPERQFRLLRSVKSRLAYPLIDPMLRLIGAKSDFAINRRVFQRLRDMRLPIVGYRTWELLLERV